MADVTVDAEVHTALHQRASRIGPVWTTKDIGYLIFHEGGTFDVRYRKTTDGGASWASSVLIDTTTGSDLSIWFDKWNSGDSGTLIHIWWLEVSTSDVHHRTLDTSTDTLGTDRIVFDGASFAGSARNNHGLSGTKAIGGNLYVQFWGDNVGERGFYRSTDGGVNWTSRTDGADGNAPDEVICLPDDDSADDQDIVMIYWDRSVDEISIKKYDNSANSWGETLISTGMADSSIVLQISAVYRHSDANIIVVAWNGLDLTTSDLKVWVISLSMPTITAKQDVITNADDCVGVALYLDQNNDDLYCAYLGNEDGSQTYNSTLTAFFKKISKADLDADNAWGSQTAYQEGTADDAKFINVGHSTPGAADGRFEPVWFNDDLNDLFVNKVNSVEIIAAAAATSFLPRYGHPMRHLVGR